MTVSKAIDQIAQQALADGKSHDFTAGLGRGDTGLTIHCNNNPLEAAGPSLQKHCHARKYTERAKTWFGVCLNPIDQALRFGINLGFPWHQSDEMDTLTKGMGKAARLPGVVSRPGTSGAKVGRNHLCPCGNGKKFKKCCLP
ncbi:SEC-C metal-binding domain-containing protein [Methylibium rhizosphaerae]|uniref:SEC-C metal-binding domain-containing protein n=1 Tax=Methylibium rhizosphaerae TaxID=2570323 RepID=UPI001127F80A|nr:SEC-C metal-binding domain-containing protein [Methylibium rhizosphaerae]